MPHFSLGDRKVSFATNNWFIAYNATVVGTVRIGDDANLWFNVVVRGDTEQITIGDRCNIQDASVLHADPGMPLTLGAGVSVGHMAMLHGCTVGDGSLIGINSVVMNRARIGKQSIVGAGTLVPEGKEFPDGVLLLGSPAKVVRNVRPDEIAWIAGIATGYVNRSHQYQREFKEG
ncbi:MAG: gamma carbonic anhydrase family protein [Betaproteobacteria bacterium]|nr:gamma carbonic anhydrase family protein [Betaproteobacteria bacterium]